MSCLNWPRLSLLSGPSIRRTMEEIYQKVINCAKAGELVTGAKLEFKEPRTSLKAPIMIPAFTKMVIDQVEGFLAFLKMKLKIGQTSDHRTLEMWGMSYPTVNL